LSIIGYYFWYQISSFNSTPYFFISSPLNDQVVNVSNITIEGETEEEIVIKINGQDVFVDSNGHFKENIVLQFGRNTLVIEAINKFGKIERETKNIIYEPKFEIEPAHIDNENDIENNAAIDLEKEKEYNNEVIGP